MTNQPPQNPFAWSHDISPSLLAGRLFAAIWEHYQPQAREQYRRCLVAILTVKEWGWDCTKLAELPPDEAMTIAANCLIHIAETEGADRAWNALHDPSDPTTPDAIRPEPIPSSAEHARQALGKRRRPLQLGNGEICWYRRMTLAEYQQVLTLEKMPEILRFVLATCATDAQGEQIFSGPDDPAIDGVETKTAYEICAAVKQSDDLDWQLELN